MPVYPSEHAPNGFQSGATQPRHALGFGHLIKLELVLEDLQYPGRGPILGPPSQSALSTGQGVQSPGDVITLREKPNDESHHIHFPTYVKYSPNAH